MNRGTGNTGESGRICREDEVVSDIICQEGIRGLCTAILLPILPPNVMTLHGTGW